MNAGKVLPALMALWIPIALGAVFDHSRTDFYSVALQSDKSAGEFVSLTSEEAFVKALIAARKPGGIVRTVDCMNTQAKPRFLFPSALVLQPTIDLIRERDPRYRFLTKGGVINLLPEGTEPELLRVRIKEFRVDKVSVPNLVIEKLLALPEIRTKSTALKSSETLKLGGLSSPSDFATPLSVHFSNVSLRDALNRIARAYGNGIWKYTEFSCPGKKKFSLDLIAQ